MQANAPETIPCGITRHNGKWMEEGVATKVEITISRS
jgi:hypothetical protein